MRLTPVAAVIEACSLQRTRMQGSLTLPNLSSKRCIRLVRGRLYPEQRGPDTLPGFTGIEVKVLVNVGT